MLTVHFTLIYFKRGVFNLILKGLVWQQALITARIGGALDS